MLENSTATVLVKFNAKNNSNNNMSCAMLCQMEKMTTEKNIANLICSKQRQLKR